MCIIIYNYNNAFIGINYYTSIYYCHIMECCWCVLVVPTVLASITLISGGLIDVDGFY